MDKFYDETLHKLETAINELEFEDDYSIQRIEAVINLILDSLSEIRNMWQKQDLRTMTGKYAFSNF